MSVTVPPRIKKMQQARLAEFARMHHELFCNEQSKHYLLKEILQELATSRVYAVEMLVHDGKGLKYVSFGETRMMHGDIGHSEVGSTCRIPLDKRRKKDARILKACTEPRIRIAPYHKRKR